MGKWVLYTQPNYAHLKPTQTHPFDTPNYRSLKFQVTAISPSSFKDKHY